MQAKILIGVDIVAKYKEDGVIDESLGNVIILDYENDSQLDFYIQGLEDAVGDIKGYVLVKDDGVDVDVDVDESKVNEDELERTHKKHKKQVDAAFAKVKKLVTGGMAVEDAINNIKVDKAYDDVDPDDYNDMRDALKESNEDVEETKKKIKEEQDPDASDTMEGALKKFIDAGWALSEVWDEDKVRQYPKYLPSFDEFLTEFSGLLEDGDNIDYGEEYKDMTGKDPSIFDPTFQKPNADESIKEPVAKKVKEVRPPMDEGKKFTRSNDKKFSGIRNKAEVEWVLDELGEDYHKLSKVGDHINVYNYDEIVATWDPKTKEMEINGTYLIADNDDVKDLQKYVDARNKRSPRVSLADFDDTDDVDESTGHVSMHNDPDKVIGTCPNCGDRTGNDIYNAIQGDFESACCKDCDAECTLFPDAADESKGHIPMHDDADEIIGGVIN